MAKTRERTFLERALEALKERHPKERATQTRLAKMAGVSQPAVHEWGLPNRAPEHPSVLKLAKELNVCVEWLYTERGPKHPAATPETEPFLQRWGELDPELRRQIARYADFVKTENTKQ
jgi:DNA-binding XRE family transcriptional regulator